MRLEADSHLRLCRRRRWSAATAGTGISKGFASLFALRLLLGMGESVAHPAYARILATFPERRRGLANAAIDPGTRTGPAVGTLLGGLLMASFGWRVFFLALGLGSMLWVVERTGQFYFAFLVAAMVALAGSAITTFGIGPVEQVKFRRHGYGRHLPAQTPPR